MSEAIRMHKRMAMNGMQEANTLKSGGKVKPKVKKYAKGGQVYPESHQPDNMLIGAYPEKGIANLPAKGNKPKLTKPVPHSVATLKKGGHVAHKPLKKAAGRGR